MCDSCCRDGRRAVARDCNCGEPEAFVHGARRADRVGSDSWAGGLRGSEAIIGRLVRLREISWYVLIITYPAARKIVERRRTSMIVVSVLVFCILSVFRMI